MKPDRYESSSGRRRLAGRTERRGAQTGFPTWGAFLFGGVFVAVGSGIVLIGIGIFVVEPSSLHAPLWVMTVFGSVFALAGMMVWGMAWKQYRSNTRRIESARAYPGEEAFADYNWDPRGFEAPRWSRPLAAAGGAGFLTLFLSIFNYWAFWAGGPWMVKAVVILFDLITLAVWWEVGLRVGRAMKFGGSRIVFPNFPYRQGEPVLVRWEPASGIELVNKGSFTLRCVEEWYESTGHGDSRNSTMVHEEVWSGTWHLETSGHPARGETVELRYEPPTDTPVTCLSGERPVFWELDVKLDLPGLDFEETYLVPLYGTR